MTIAESVERDGIGWQEGFLTRKECRVILEELEFALWRDNQVVNLDEHGELTSFTSDRRISEGTNAEWFSPRLLTRLGRIEQRLLDEFGVEPRFLESWQAVRYRPGGKFSIHHDGGVFGQEPAGERVLTFLIYLREPKEGGETYFPERDLVLRPLAGTLAVWNNLLPDGSRNDDFRHAATPVHRGRKVILTTWSRQRPTRGGQA